MFIRIFLMLRYAHCKEEKIMRSSQKANTLIDVPDDGGVGVFAASGVQGGQFAPQARFYRDVPETSTSSTQSPIVQNNNNTTSNNIFDISSMPSFEIITTNNITNNNLTLSETDMSSRNADITALMGFGFSLLVYFCMVIYLAYRGSGAAKRDVDYCLVQKEVLAHEVAHDFTEELNAPNSQRCSCCSHSPSVVRSKTGPRNRSKCSEQKAIPNFRSVVQQNNSSNSFTGNAESTSSLVTAESVNSLNPTTRLPSLLSSPSEMVSASVILARYRARNENDADGPPRSISTAGGEGSRVIMASPSNLIWHIESGARDFSKENEVASEQSTTESCSCRMDQSITKSINGAGKSEQLKVISDLDITKEEAENCMSGIVDQQPCNESNDISLDIAMDENELPMCPICLSHFCVGEIVSFTKLRKIDGGCSHCFHYDCVLPWCLLGHVRCPVCREIFWSRNAKSAVRRSQMIESGLAGSHNIRRDISGSHRRMNIERKSLQLQRTMESVSMRFAGVAGNVDETNGCESRTVAVTAGTDALASHGNSIQKMFRESVPTKSRAEDCNFCVVCGLVSH